MPRDVRLLVLLVVYSVMFTYTANTTPYLFQLDLGLLQNSNRKSYFAQLNRTIRILHT